MNAYTGFARVYETFMDNVPYDEWAEYVVGILQENGVKDALVAELGCGTGSMTRRLARAGYDMIGIDLSEEMLDVARYGHTCCESASNGNVCDGDAHYGHSHNGHEEEEMGILYLNQDMREFELYGTVAAVVSLCDSMNYITSEEELLQVFRLVNNYLDAGGLFLFDMNTVYKYETLLGDRVIAENRDDCSLIWENYYDKDSRINQYDITIYVKAEFEEEVEQEAEQEMNPEPEAAMKLGGSYEPEETLESEAAMKREGFLGSEVEMNQEDSLGAEGAAEPKSEEAAETLPPLFERLEETHIQKAYPVETVISLIEQAGMEFVAVYGAGTKEAPKPDCERVYFLAREKRQENKYYGDRG